MHAHILPRHLGSHGTACCSRSGPHAVRIAIGRAHQRASMQVCFHVDAFSSSTSTSSSHHRTASDLASDELQAHPRRVAKVASQIQREISEMFIYDKVVQAAICPEKRVGLDDKLSAVASITHVYVSNDLQVVEVYVSVYSDEKGKERAINNLKHIAPYVRSQIGQAIKLRLTPEVRFEYDDTYDELEKIQEAIGQDDFNRYVAEAEAESRGQPINSSSSSQPGSNAQYNTAEEEDDDDDDDSGFFDIADADADTSDLPTTAAAAAGDLAAAAASSSSSGDSSAVRHVSWSSHDPQTFFAVDVDEDEDDADHDVSNAWYRTAGPFDDLFRGSGETLAQPRGQQQQQQGQKKKQQKQEAASM